MSGRSGGSSLPDFRALHREPGSYAVARLEAGSAWPAWASSSRFTSVTCTPAETSVVCEAACVPAGITVERGFSLFVVPGPIPFQATGVLHALAAPLARVGVSLLALGTHDTDYLLVRSSDESEAVAAWRAAGIEVTLA